MSQRRLPEFFYNWISIGGALLAMGSFAIIALLVLIDLFVESTTLYLGLLTYTILPGFLVAGLVLIAVGALLERRREAKGHGASLDPVFSLDLRNARQRTALFIFVGGTAVFLVASALGTYKAYHITESTKFCGTLCHTVMNPEYTAYQRSAHARVACVSCHIGPGAGWFVKSKLSGAYQVYSAAFKKYHRPIETPVRNLRPARETCEQCHWPEKFFGERRHVNPRYLADEKNTPYPLTLLINTGGGGSLRGPGHGIHWHMAINNKVEYIARDRARQEIAWLRVTNRSGQMTEFNLAENPLTVEERRQAEIRVMDCIDCHNRPSHNYRPPTREVDAALYDGRIPATLPFIKRESVKALDGDYPDTPSAIAAIDQKLRGFYQEKFAKVSKERSAEVEAAVLAVQDIYRHSLFPEMKVTWRQYPENIGHTLSPGCFRCHGSGLTSSDGKTISRNCTSCHVLLGQGKEPGDGLMSVRGLTFKHPTDIGGAEAEGNCTACHQGGAELYE